MSILVVSNVHFTGLFERARNGEADAFQTMLDSLLSAVETTASPLGLATAAQTVQEVKDEFHAFLECLTCSRGLASTPISVYIDDAAFGRMLDEPTYKQRMMDLCVRDLSHSDWTGRTPPSSIEVFIDGNSEYLCRCWNLGADDPHAAPRTDNFWNRQPTDNDIEDTLAETAAERREMWELLFARATERREFDRENPESPYEAKQAFG